MNKNVHVNKKSVLIRVYVLGGRAFFQKFCPCTNLLAQICWLIWYMGLGGHQSFVPGTNTAQICCCTILLNLAIPYSIILIPIRNKQVIIWNFCVVCYFEGIFLFICLHFCNEFNYRFLFGKIRLSEGIFFLQWSSKAGFMKSGIQKSF